MGMMAIESRNKFNNTVIHKIYITYSNLMS